MKLDEYPNWIVQYVPLPRLKDPVASHGALLSILNRSKVSLRGWDFPHIGTNEGDITNVNEGVKAECTWRLHPEATLATFDGIFIHRQALREDIQENWGRYTVPWIDFVNTIWSIYEFFEFMSRYYTELAHDGQLQVTVRLNKLNGRILGTGDSRVFLRQRRPARESEFIFEAKLEEEQWKSGYREVATQCTQRLFGLLNFLEIGDRTIVEWQQRLMDRKY